jgi:endoglucanase
MVRKNKKSKNKLFVGAGILGMLALFLGAASIHAAATSKNTVSAQLSASVLNSAQTTPSTVASGTTTKSPNTTKSSGSSSTGSSITTGGGIKSTPTAVQHSLQTVGTNAASSISYPTTLYTNPTGEIATDAEAWAATNPGDAPRMNRLASMPMAEWYVGLNTNIQSDVNSYVTAASTAGQLPVLVAYNIPDRDCGGDSAGGASTAAAYTAWIAGLAAGIGNRPAMVIIEPDALAGMDCLSSANQQTRLQLIAAAIHTLKTETAAKVYIDAGNSNWQTAAVMATRLESADISEADGFSLNVSNFYTTSSNISYGTQLSQLVGNKHFVIDTSRNGTGPDSADDWCNPAGRAVGQTPTLQTDTSLVDAYLWVKGPGGSDGACGPTEDGTSAPAAGIWWPQDALALMEAAGW